MAKWQHPFPKSTITDKFADKEPPRTSPHRGLDYAPKSRALIPAITDAVVTKIFWSDCLGWVCEMKTIEHGIFIGHSHLFCNKHNTINCDGSDHTDGSTCMKNLSVGDRVKVGQPVGRVGNSGSCSRGAHLHLSFSKKTDPRYAKVFDPEMFIDQKISKQSKAIAKAKTKTAAKPKAVKVTPKKMGRFWTREN